MSSSMLRRRRLRMMGGGSSFSAATNYSANIAGIYASFRWSEGLFEDDGMTIPALDNGDQIGGWADAINANDVVKSVAGTRPTLLAPVSNGTKIFKAVRGDGSDDSLRSAASVTHTIGTADYIWAFVIRPLAVATTYEGVCSNGAFAPAVYVHNGKINHYFGADRNFDTTLVVNTWYSVIVGRESGVLKCWINGSQEATTHSVATSMADAGLALHNDNVSGVGNPGTLDIALADFAKTTPTAQLISDIYNAYHKVECGV